MSGAAPGIGLRRLQHLVLWVSDVERSVRFYRDVLGFEVKSRYPGAAFLKIPGSPDDHHLGLFEQPGVPGPDEGAGPRRRAGPARHRAALGVSRAPLARRRRKTALARRSPR